MKKDLEFTKMEGAGNDFILVDDRRGALKKPADIAKRLCDRKRSVGSDGLIVLGRSRSADIRMRIFNSDGSEADMCGNGVRCLARFANDRKVARQRLSIESGAGIIQAEVKKNGIVKVRLSDPKDLDLDFSIAAAGRHFDAHFINTGVPHTVIPVEDVRKADVQKWGEAVRYHARFAPRGTNANFIQFLGPGRIAARTYERGVEGETLSCGTGSAASALVAAAVKNYSSPVKIETKSGQTLTIHFTRDSGSFRDVYLEGPVTVCFEGRVSV